MREHSAANESLKLALDKQGGATLFVVSVELPKEGPEVLAYYAVQHSALRGAAYVGSRDLVARGGSVNPHEYGIPSRLVPLSARTIRACL
jgi:hypothetical protein